MANFPPIFLNTTNGRHERLLPADGGMQIDVIDCAVGATDVKLFETVDGTGTVEVLKNFTGSVTIGKVGGWFNFGGGVHVQQGLETHGTTLLSGDVELGSVGTHNILFNGKISTGTVTFTASVPHTLLLDQGALTLQTTTSGKIALNSGADLDFDAATSSAFNAGTTMSFVSVGAAEFKSTGAATALTLGGFGATIPLNAAAPNNALVGFTAGSLVGALNELRAAVSDTVPTALAGEAITKGDLICLDDDAGTPKLYLCDNASATRNRPVGISISTGTIAPGSSVSYTTVGRAIVNTTLLTANHGDYVFMAAAPNQGKVTVTPPVAGTVMVVGTVALGAVAGSAKIIYQPLLPTTF